MENIISDEVFYVCIMIPLKYTIFKLYITKKINNNYSKIL
jgi:hypothetical protein